MADQTNRLVRKINLTADFVSTLAGRATQGGAADGAGTTALFDAPSGIAMDAVGNVAFVADSGNHLIRRINVSTGVVSTLAGSAGLSGSADGQRTSALFHNPSSIASDAAGAVIVVADRLNNAIRRMNVRSGVVTTVAGRSGAFGSADGIGSLATFNQPWGVALDPAGSFALVADTFNFLIRRVELPSGAVSLVAGSVGVAGHADGRGTVASFKDPWGIAVNIAGNFALVVSAKLKAKA